MVSEIGCADGTREAFQNPVAYPEIAGCSGGFRIPGLDCPEPPACSRQGGDDGLIPQGQGCNAEDLCAEGWHVCLSAAEVGLKSMDGCDGANDAPPNSFYATRQSGPGFSTCATCGGNACLPGCTGTAEVTTNDLFGCGSIGSFADAGTCGVLTRTSNDLCSSLPQSWRCGQNGQAELANVRHRQPFGGGILCCKD